MCLQQEAFLAFTQTYARIIASAIRRVCGSAYHALYADVEQEVYLALWQRWQSGNGIDYPVSYLYTVALRTALVVVRSSASGDVDIDTIKSRPHTGREASIEGCSPAEFAVWLTELLDHLPVEQARAVRAYLAGFTQPEIAALYGWSASVARHRVYRGLHALKDYAMQDRV